MASHAATATIRRVMPLPVTWPADPDADRRRSERTIHDPGDVGFEAREVDLLPEPLGERRGGSVAVVARAVESMVDEPLDAAANGLEERERDERRGRHGEGLALHDPIEDGLEADHRAAEHRHEDPVTRVQPIVRLMSRSIS